MGRKLYVGNLPYSTSEAELEELFGRAGSVESVNVMRDMATGRARGFAFVEMATDEEAQRAIQELDQQELGGRRLTVNEANPGRRGRATVVSGTGAAIDAGSVGGMAASVQTGMRDPSQSVAEKVFHSAGVGRPARRR